MKTENLEVKNITLKEIANGKVFDDKEAIEVAKRILDAKKSSEFNKFRFFYPGANASRADLRDCLTDFNLFAGEVKLYKGKNAYKQFLGFTKEETLAALSEFIFINNEEEDLTFSVRGYKGRFPVNLTFFHYCFAKGRISVDEMLNMLKEELVAA